MSILTEAHPELILASASPRRAELTRQLGLVPIVRVSQTPEAREPGELPAAYTVRLAKQKAAAVAAMIPADDPAPAWILAADTVVTLDDDVLEKPTDAAHARQMLAALSGRSHEVITGFCWRNRQDGRTLARAITAKVRFHALDEETIARYVATGEPMDKAGAYGIQGIGGALIAGLEGSYTCVVGLPVAEVIAALRELGGLGPYPFVAASRRP